MVNHAQKLNKYYIKQFIINNYSSQEWLDKNYDEICKEDAIIGYAFNTREPNLSNTPEVLNLYLLKHKYNDGKVSISRQELADAWELFLFKIDSEKKAFVFKNPPIDKWLDTKDNWCKKLANELSNQFDRPFHDCLSEIYLTVMKCANKGTIYLGNLNYIRRATINNILCDMRDNKHRLNMNNILVTSLDITIDTDNAGNDVYLSDIIAAPEDVSEESLEYQDLLASAKRLLSKSFSEREIDQILNLRAGYLPTNLYRRLFQWRAKHKVEDIYES